MKLDDLIGLNAYGFVRWLGIYAPETKIAFGPDDEKSPGLMNLVETCEVQIASVENVNGSRFYDELVEEMDLVDFAMGYEDQLRNAASQIHQGVKFDRSFALAELSPGEKRQTEIDGGCVEGINGLLQLDAEAFLGIETAGLGDQDLGEVGVYFPIADLVGMSQGIARDFSPKAHGIEFLLVAPEAGLDVSEAFAITELGKSHTEELIPAGKGFDFVVPPDIV